MDRGEQGRFASACRVTLREEAIPKRPLTRCRKSSGQREASPRGTSNSAIQDASAFYHVLYFCYRTLGAWAAEALVIENEQCLAKSPA